MEYPVYRLSYKMPENNQDKKKIFFKKNLNDIFDYLEKQIQCHLYVIEGLDEDANFHEIDISDKLYKKEFYATNDNKILFVDTNEEVFKDLKKGTSEHSDMVALLATIGNTYINNNYQKFSYENIQKLKVLFNTNDIEEYGINPYLTKFKRG